jgi:uncharacterized membrane protein YcaP (DUF421 family)
MNYMWEALLILFFGFCLLRILGKKAVAEMTSLEIITLLAMASMIGHAIAGDGFGIWRTAVTLSLFVALLITVQYLTVKFDFMERLFLGRATLVIRDGQIQYDNLKKLRMSVDQLEARIREKGIVSFSDIKTGTIELNGQLGYELIRTAKPVTVGELEKLLASMSLPAMKETQETDNLFTEAIYQQHQHPVPDKYN